MSRQSNRTIWIGKISFIDRNPDQLVLAHERFPDALTRALDPNRPVSHYREWRLSQPRGEGRTIAAELGFRRRTRQEEVDYDDERHEWISSEAAAPQGNFAHFVVDLETQLVGFEDRGKDLSRDAFANVLGKFLEASGLEINLISDTRKFAAWLEGVDMVTRFRVTLRQPNPGWSKRAQQVRDLAQEVDPDWLTIEARSMRGLNVRDTLLDGAADTASMGNGEFKATGLSGGSRRFFDSAKRFVSGIIEVSNEDSSSTIASKIGDLMEEIAPKPPSSCDDEESDDG
jgi:hypothetical protein